MLPLLAAIEQQGGRARPRDLYDDVADQLLVPAAARERTATFADGRESVLFERQVRWARQTAILRGHIAAPSRGIWEVTAGGKNALRNVRRGVIVPVFETDAGVVVAAHVEDAVDLLFTSPPFPLLSGRRTAGSIAASGRSSHAGPARHPEDRRLPGRRGPGPRRVDPPVGERLQQAVTAGPPRRHGVALNPPAGRRDSLVP